MQLLQKIIRSLYVTKKKYIAGGIYQKLRKYTMMEKGDYIKFLEFVYEYKNQEGDVVECGVWRGGAIAGIAAIMSKKRKYYLYDSFEGLPAAKEIDGEAALNWQNKKDKTNYFDNCSAEIEFAQNAMKEVGKFNDSHIIKGWFEDTIPKNDIKEIAILRLDGDWYESTMICLEHLFEKVKKGGLIIIDDYYTWDGCTRALHDYLSKHKRTEKIRSMYSSGCYLIKQ
jgi:O-methyltransferase